MVWRPSYIPSEEEIAKRKAHYDEMEAWSAQVASINRQMEALKFDPTKPYDVKAEEMRQLRIRLNELTNPHRDQPTNTEDFYITEPLPQDKPVGMRWT